jgi:hypothetical protein
MVAGHGAKDFLTDADAVAQAVKTRLLLLLGEWWEDLEDGLPLYQSIVGIRDIRDNLTAADLLVRDRILRTEGVSEILSLESAVDPKDRVITYKTVIKTLYGTVDLDEFVQADDLSGIGGDEYLFHTHKLPAIAGHIVIGGVSYEMEPVGEESTGFMTPEYSFKDTYLYHVHALPAVIGRIHVNGKIFYMEAADAEQTHTVDLTQESLESFETHTHTMPAVRGKITINGNTYYMEPTSAGVTSGVASVNTGGD